ncbi:MAG: FliM/FliN family flagellar motor switch protein [Pseudotabrizicola sp.]|uniref:FliM/FliN family flagellar motor switch protein n=1 Tax=Pseudotabrizicola sp. TaxID=2939647 RepID=UPI0027173A50|nr:FliM/FliN family flagellar motor switch protein [Pseudotabrizicola sp.]MDO9637313.1 FliM/FliN family flagellar motor switch protein [Pseudotabrizicola sp.]
MNPLVTPLRETGAKRIRIGVAVAGEVLRRKLKAKQQAAAEGGPGADRAWRISFARAARDMMDLPVDFVSLSTDRLSLAELLDVPPERALILMLEGPEEGLGLLILSPDLLSALIEALTIGKCGTQTPDPRKPTRTDAAMLSPMADLALSHLEEALAEDSDLVWASGFRFASFIEEARPLGLLLEDVTYRVLTARLSVFFGARVGDMWLVLPAAGRGRKPRLAANAVPSSVSRPAFSAALASRVDAASCQIEAVLTRLSMPLSEVMGLSADMVLPLPTAALDRICLDGLDGRHVGEGRLGQHRGMRALRLTAEIGASDAPVAGMGAADAGRTAAMDAGGMEDLPSETAAAWGDPAPMPEAPLDFDFGGFSATGTD